MASASWNRSGTWLVVGMIGFGLALTAALFVYSLLHTAPFRAITASIGERYPGSAPRVEGGRPRLDRPGETLLRIVMRSPFDPADEQKADTLAREVATFVASRHSLSQFDVIEIHLFHPLTSGESSQRSIRLNVEEILAASGKASDEL